MNPLINIDNYEIFYLDFLEGNLSEEERHAFLTFLEQHPELQLEDEELPVLTAEHVTFPNEFKQTLLVFDAQTTLTNENSEAAMIASVEGLLNPAQEADLQALIERDEKLKTEYQLYRKTRLVADPSLVFEGKQGLKRGLVIPMYARVLSIAASLILALMLIPFSGKESFDTGSTTAYLQASFQAKKLNLNSKPIQVEAGRTKQRTVAVSEKSQREFTLADLPLSLSFKALPKLGKQELISEPVALSFASVQETGSEKTDDQDLAYLSLDEMKNPIKPITRSIGNKFKKDLDFRTAKASKTKQGGFYIKIGRFELTRKTSPQPDVLAMKP